ncbi:DMT family transporter [Sphingomonas sp.]|jgi:drug/metabolite transporter (DMT)-like permease|uniref:DMT family transporter n=1 Tax=Sphingomonas sp. TaxID=28214 RepID=UPI002E2EE01C|nr:DMT family transporter [Sphingomonas sp.]HEX4695391.1 DMT family transporter [Sphingomonas sp.]
MHQDAAPRKGSSSKSVAAHPLAFAGLVVANVALAFGPLFVRMADVGPVAVGFWRIALAAPVLVAMAAASGWRPRGTTPGLWAAVVIGGVCFAADLASWHIGILKTSLANATFFGNSATLFFPIYGFVVARAWPSRMQGFALLLALVGAALLMGRSLQIAPGHFGGDLLCLLAGVLYTFYFAAMAKARDTMAPVPALAASTLASVLPLLLFALFMREAIMPHDWTPLIAVALASQVLGQGLMIFALGQLSPLIVGIGLLIQPVVAAAIGWIGYGERLDAVDLAGAVLVAVALVLVRRSRDEPAELAPEGVEEA